MRDELRKKRLQTLIDSKFGGSQTEITKAMGWSNGRCSQLLSPKYPFGEDAAIKIVEKLSLDKDYFNYEEKPQMINVVADEAYRPTAGATLIAKLFDMIPEDDLIRRTKASSAATTVIIAVIEGHDIVWPIFQPGQDQKKPPE